MAAYGLYTHIASNKFRSMLLLAGLFVLIYVIVYAGALIAEVIINSDASVDYYLVAAMRDLVVAFPYATGIAALHEQQQKNLVTAALQGVPPEETSRQTMRLPAAQTRTG